MLLYWSNGLCAGLRGDQGISDGLEACVEGERIEAWLQEAHTS